MKADVNRSRILGPVETCPLCSAKGGVGVIFAPPNEICHYEEFM